MKKKVIHSARIGDSRARDATMKKSCRTTMKLSEALRDIGHPVAYYPSIAGVFGLQESIFLAQFVYWTGKGSNPDGWIYKSAEEIHAETGLSYEQQRRVRSKLLGERRDGKGRYLGKPLIEPVLEERYDRVEHRIYFRVDKDALDRMFSNRQLELFPGGHMDIVQVPHGHSPSRLYTETTTETTNTSQRTARVEDKVIRNAVRMLQRDQHKQFVAFFDKISKSARGKKPTYDAAGFRNLKLALKVTDFYRLEQLALFYLADPAFKKYAVDLKTFLSGGMMKALGEQWHKDGAMKRLNSYIDKYLAGRYSLGVDMAGGAIGDLITNLAKKFAEK